MASGSARISCSSRSLPVKRITQLTWGLKVDRRCRCANHTLMPSILCGPDGAMEILDGRDVMADAAERGESLQVLLISCPDPLDFHLESLRRRRGESCADARRRRLQHVEALEATMTASEIARATGYTPANISRIGAFRIVIEGDPELARRYRLGGESDARIVAALKRLSGERPQAQGGAR